MRSRCNHHPSQLQFGIGRWTIMQQLPNSKNRVLFGASMSLHSRLRSRCNRHHIPPRFDIVRLMIYVFHSTAHSLSGHISPSAHSRLSQIMTRSSVTRTTFSHHRSTHNPYMTRHAQSPSTFQHLMHQHRTTHLGIRGRTVRANQ